MWALLGIGGYLYLKLMFLFAIFAALYFCFLEYKKGGWRAFFVELFAFFLAACFLWLGYTILTWIF